MVSLSDMQDIINLTLAEFPKKIEDVTSGLAEYYALGNLLKKNKLKTDGGKLVEFRVIYQDSGDAEEIGLFHSDTVSVIDHTLVGRENWKHLTKSYSYDKKELAANKGDKQIINMVKERRDLALEGCHTKVEKAFFSDAPATENTLSLHGMKTFIVTNATEGFNGNLPSGWSRVGNIDPTVATGWRNYTARHSGWTQADFAAKIRKAYRETNFTSPVKVAPGQRNGLELGLYTTWDGAENIRQMVQTLNAGAVNTHGNIQMFAEDTYKGVPFFDIPQITEDDEALATPVLPV